MSTETRSTPRGGKNVKVEAAATPKTQKLEVNKSESPKTGLDKSQTPTADQMRMAEIMDTNKNDLDIKDKIKQVMDATQKTEDEVSTALHDCDNDANKAVNLLLEGSIKNEWSIKHSKKKNRTASGTKAEGGMNNHVGGSGEGEDWDTPQGEVSGSAPTTGGRGRDRPRPPRGNGPPRMRGRGSSQWRTRENKENERNLEDGYSSERGRRGDRGGRMSNGPSRGGRGGRGGGRLGSRTFQSRDKPGQGFPRSIDTWNPTDNSTGEKMENWDNGGEDWDTEESKPKPNESWADDGFPSPEDWDNEEYTGSLADSKVFTPSTGPEPSPPQALPDPDTSVDPVEPSPTSGTATAPPSTALDLQPQSRPTQMPPSSVTGSTLTPAQTQYLTQLTQQSSESYKAATSVGAYTQQYPAQYPPPAASVAYPATYGVTANSFSTLPEVTSNQPSQQAPARTKAQKPRVPPPSKIPSTAVEMPPGDAIAVAMLDVQFGVMEFTDPPPLDTSTTLDVTSTTVTTVPSPASAPTPTSVSASVASIMESYAAANNQQQQTNLVNALTHTQKLTQITQGEAVLQTQNATELAATAVSVAGSYSGQSTAASSVMTNSTAVNNKSEAYNSSDAGSSALYQSTQYHKPSTASNVQVSYPSSTTYNNSYSTSQVTSTAVGNSGYSSQTSGYTSGSGVTAYSSTANSVSQSNAIPNSYLNTNQTSYPAYTSYPTANSYQSSAQTYPPQTYQGVTSAASFAYPTSSYPPSAAIAQQNHKINAAALASSQGKDSQYESGQVTNNSIPAVSTVNSTASLGLSSHPATSQSAASTKVALSTANKSGVVTGIPPQVPPMMNTQYIMSQATGLPYFQQPILSYEDFLLQQRIPAPPIPTGYFDMSFQQQPTSLGTARDGSLGNVAYSMSSDGRFTRADNNASPVPSTLSQQQTVTQGHQQTILNPSLPPGYTYIYSGYPNFQYGTPLYPMAATAAAGNSTSGQYKGPGYGSAAGYSSAYETAADGYKVGSAGGYSATPTQTKTGGTPTTSADLYSKGHATLNKVNSYEKAGFHSGTPPPFNLGGSQSAMAPSTTFPPHLYISTLPPHQQHAHSNAALIHQPLQQIEMRNHTRRMDGTSNSGPRSQASSQPNKAGTKQQNYNPSFWANPS